MHSRIRFQIDNPISPRGDGNCRCQRGVRGCHRRSITPFPREGTETMPIFVMFIVVSSLIDNPISPRGDGNFVIITRLKITKLFIIDNPISPRGDGNFSTNSDTLSAYVSITPFPREGTETRSGTVFLSSTVQSITPFPREGTETGRL